MAQAKLVRFSSPRTELHDALGLTGCEVSFNEMPAGAEIPFVHCHEQNEEVYIVLDGSGKVWLDGAVTDIAGGDCLLVAPAEHRCLKAGAQGLKYICIQARAGSLAQFTMTDGKIVENEKPQW
ncbi:MULTISPECIES: cupin domain-containing protein [unclassified Desulfovibrio]|uniref:cupin domain-containing protein n=1 Tax=unclassified Desulfovibrio TaxID=2593640 RepID=UPI000F5E7E5C|nr:MULTISPECIES: cupin domain-containing protein [unclassified Desulfovibrio]RRD69528.1 cupin domain-containing protein [Desulfovibrio sp. OH1209_COT-279]RRD86202.1 cupin domain-containing protein [Desulfovibrio sp. OH1186_COT-070]